MRPERAFPVAVGVVAALLLAAFYLSIVTLAEESVQAREQFLEDLPFLVFLFPGFGTQVGIYAHVRLLMAQVRAAGTVTGTAGGVSATAVVACCAHFLPTLLPIVGVSALSALLAAWKTPLLVVAILANLAGIVYMLRVLRRHGRMLHSHHRPA